MPAHLRDWVSEHALCSHTEEASFVAGLFSKLTRFASTPQGRQAIRKAQEAAKDPATRRKIDSGLERVRREIARRGGGGNPGGTPTGPVPGRPPQS